MGHQLARRPLVAFKILSIFIVCGGGFAHSDVCTQAACLRYGFARGRVCAAGGGWIKF
nr:hypothetical protein [uncultured Campylobacter sp.]